MLICKFPSNPLGIAFRVLDWWSGYLSSLRHSLLGSSPISHCKMRKIYLVHKLVNLQIPPGIGPVASQTLHHVALTRLASSSERRNMSSFAGYQSLAPKTKNLIIAGGLTGFVLGVYYYTMRAVGGTDELQVAIDKFEELKKKGG